MVIDFVLFMMYNMLMKEKLAYLTQNTLIILKEILESKKEYITIEDIRHLPISDEKGKGACMAALTKQRIDGEQAMTVFAKKDMVVKRRRGTEYKNVLLSTKMWKVNSKLFREREDLLSKIDEILEVLEKYEAPSTP